MRQVQLKQKQSLLLHVSGGQPNGASQSHNVPRRSEDKQRLEKGLRVILNTRKLELVHAGTSSTTDKQHICTKRMFSYYIQCSWITHTFRKHTHCVIEAGAATLSANSRAGWRSFNQDILQLNDEAAGRDVQSSQTRDSRCHSTCDQKESPECKQDFPLAID